MLWTFLKVFRLTLAWLIWRHMDQHCNGAAADGSFFKCFSSHNLLIDPAFPGEKVSKAGPPPHSPLVPSNGPLSTMLQPLGFCHTEWCSECFLGRTSNPDCLQQQQSTGHLVDVVGSIWLWSHDQFERTMCLVTLCLLSRCLGHWPHRHQSNFHLLLQPTPLNINFNHLPILSTLSTSASFLQWRCENHIFLLQIYVLSTFHRTYQNDEANICWCSIYNIGRIGFQGQRGKSNQLLVIAIKISRISW